MLSAFTISLDVMHWLFYICCLVFSYNIFNLFFKLFESSS